jgi:hypothetical protein
MTNNDSPKSAETPKWLGPVFIVVGLITFLGKPAVGIPYWVAIFAPLSFILVGVALCLQTLHIPKLSKFFWVFFSVSFLIVFNWAAFGPGERMGTLNFLIGQKSSVNVRPMFVVAVSFIDLAVLFYLFMHLKRKMNKLDSKGSFGS